MSDGSGALSKSNFHDLGRRQEQHVLKILFVIGKKSFFYVTFKTHVGLLNTMNTIPVKASA
jgi:hypothetical protein